MAFDADEIESQPWHKILGVCVMMPTVLLPTLWLWGESRLAFNDPMFPLVAAVVAAGGAVGLIMYSWDQRRPADCFLCGAILGLGVLLAFTAYDVGRPIGKYEMLLVSAVGATPGLWLFARLRVIRRHLQG